MIYLDLLHTDSVDLILMMKGDRLAQDTQTGKQQHRTDNRWVLVCLDILVYLCVCFVFLVIYSGDYPLTWPVRLFHTGLGMACVFSARFIGGIYRQIWRYGGIQCFMRLLLTDGAAFLLFLALGRIPPKAWQIVLVRALSISTINLLIALSMRMMYRYAYKCSSGATWRGRVMQKALGVFHVENDRSDGPEFIRAAIIGAGKVGVSLAVELMSNQGALCIPVCFVDSDSTKAGRQIHDIPVLAETDDIINQLTALNVQEIIIAIPDADT